MLRLVFMGSDAIALPLLNWLAGEGRECGIAEIVAVFTQPDRAVGRGQKVTPNAIKTWALAHGLPVYQPEKLTEETRAELAVLKPDVTLVMAYGHILRDSFIATPRLGTLNLHTSLLPKYRGASPIQTAVACGERETGVTLMRIVRQLDAGPIADVEKVEIGPRDTALEVEARLSEACVPLIARALPQLAVGMLQFREQDHAAATFCRKLTKADGTLDFSAPAAELAARINGLFPWPACSVDMGGQRVKIGQADSIDSARTAIGLRNGRLLPGSLISQLPSNEGATGECLCIATGTGILRLHAMQRPGGRMLSANEFLRGFHLANNMRLLSEPMPNLLVTSPMTVR